MRIPLRILAIGAALGASPALAQIGVGIGGQGGGGLGVGIGGQAGGNLGVGVGGNIGAGVNAGGTIDSMNRTLDRTVTTTDRTVNRALSSDLRAATSADLTAGASVRDNRGHRIGAVQSISGNMAVVVNNGRMVHVPLASLYRGASGLVSNLSRAQLDAMASANANAGAGVRR